MSKFWPPHLLYPRTPKCVINQRYFVLKLIKKYKSWSKFLSPTHGKQTFSA